MQGLILTRDTPQAIALEASRIPAAVLFAASAGVGVVLHAFFPGLLVARGILAVVALWSVSRLLTVHRLKLDLDNRTYRYERGWLFAPPIRQGSFDDLAAVVVEPRAEAPAASRLRSRLLVLEFADWGEGRFVLGFPMGPQVAADKAADYGHRLGVPVLDRTAEEGVTEGAGPAPGENVQS